MELAQLSYVAIHFLVDVLNTLIHNFELNPDLCKISHFPNCAWNSCLTTLSR